ncbi:hypothetical protein [Holdemanella porci]|uniref:hypothetical protein n=1 Tax=Holdemanella porci TaxID=2652276 RepID=UPI00388D77ED
MKAKELFGKLGYKKQVSFDSICFVYENEDTSDFEIIFDLKSKKIHTYGACSDKSISIDELNAIYKQCGELGWIEEEKRETNFEYYKDEILEYCIDHLAVVKGRLQPCYKTNCNDCDFKTIPKRCHEMAKDWLKQPHEKPVYKLTKFEKELLQCYPDIYSFKVFNSLNGMKEKGHFKGIDTRAPIHEILDNYEVIE